MKIVGCDLHTRYQQIAMLDTETGELTERRLEHESGQARAFYAGLAGEVRVGIKATGHTRWFERMDGWPGPAFRTLLTLEGAPPEPVLLGWGFSLPFDHCFRSNSQALSSLGRPLGLNLHRSFAASRIMTKAAPHPILRARYQPALHRIPVHVVQLLKALVFAPNVEIVIPRLPKVAGVARHQPARHRLFHRLNGRGKKAPFRLADQQVDMFGHDHVSVHEKSVTTTRIFKGAFH